MYLFLYKLVNKTKITDASIAIVIYWLKQSLCSFLIVCTPITVIAAEHGAKYVMLAKGNTRFALELYQELRQVPGNVFFSPYSISSALAIAYAGARGETATQMVKVLHFEMPHVHQLFSELNSAVGDASKNQKVDLNIANAIWMQKGSKLLKKYVDVVNNFYNTTPFEAAFSQNPDAAKNVINDWVAQQTKQKIKNFLETQNIDSSTQLLLVNAIYFNADWATQFDINRTNAAPFWLTDTETIDVPMMAQKSSFYFSESDDLKILKLPYSGNDLFMLLLLPSRKADLGNLEEKLNSENLAAWQRDLRETEVQVYLPKISLSATIQLSSILAAMGMPAAFGQSADFSTINGSQNLYISSVQHKALVDINEQGTEAAAASGVSVATKIFIPTPVFRADRPFIFIIGETQTSSLLFIGRVANPSER